MDLPQDLAPLETINYSTTQWCDIERYSGHGDRQRFNKCPRSPSLLASFFTERIMREL